MDIKEKLEKEEKRLENLKAQKSAIEEKIKKAESEVAKYKGILNQKKFSEVSQVLESKGLTIDEILQAIAKGDILSLQERMEENEKLKEEKEEVAEPKIESKDE